MFIFVDFEILYVLIVFGNVGGNVGAGVSHVICTILYII